ncbi:MAG: hypothetical protein ACTHN0_05285 [Aquihabitans sp.]
MQLHHYIGLLHRAEHDLAASFREVAQAHVAEPDIEGICLQLAEQCDRHERELEPFVDRFGEESGDEPDRMHSDLFGGTREGPLALLRDLHDLYLMASECDITWTLVGQAARSIRDEELVAVVESCEGETSTQLAWLRTRSKAAAPQALVVAR